MAERSKIKYRAYTFSGTDIVEGNLHLVASFLSTQLEANTLSVTLRCSDPNIVNFNRVDPLDYSFRGRQIGIFYPEKITKKGRNQYRIVATSAIGLLSEREHRGGIYTGQTVAEILSSILGPIPYRIKSDLLTMQIYGWLPWASARDNLAQLLIAIGAVVKTDLDGIIRIEALWDGLSWDIGPNRLYPGGDVEGEAKVTAVQVTEHQYIPGTETKKLFEGTSLANQLVIFEEPIHSLTATGFIILESGANYAILSAGTGTLTGKAYTHLTRQIQRPVSTAQNDNVKPIKKCTLISLANSEAVADRLAQFYQSRDTLTVPVVYAGEKPGDRLRIHQPVDNIKVMACLKSADVAISASTLKAHETLLLDFVPANLDAFSTYDQVQTLTDSGTFTVPPNVHKIHAVLISGGSGGDGGSPGGSATAGAIHNASYANTYYEKGYNSGEAGEGGAPGAGGAPGKVLEITLNVTPGQTIRYHCGLGGTGGTAGTPSVPPGAGNAGGATTFGEHSSENGASPPNGYINPLTGEGYALSGDNGIAGGKGSRIRIGLNENGGYTWVDEPGDAVIGPDGIAWQPGENAQAANKFKVDESNTITIVAALSKGSSGGGAAVGSNGGNGQKGSAYHSSGSYNSSTKTYTYSASASGGTSGNGASASPPTTIPSKFGCGGIGGNGGGGAGAASAVVCGGCSSYKEGSTTYTVKVNMSFGSRPVGLPGNGSQGGAGAPGCIILFLTVKEPIRRGATLTRKKAFCLDCFGRIRVV